MAKHGKKYREAFDKVDRSKKYTPLEAVTLAKELAYAKFDETLEIHVRLGVDPRHADQIVRDLVNLPHGLGKTVRVLVFAQGEDATKAREAGADYIADGDDLINKIEGGWFDFDIALATPNMMGKVGKLGPVLGPRGMMPNPKAGTMIPGEDLPRVIDEAKSGRIEYRVDKTANIHVPIGKVSFSAEQLHDNMSALMESLVSNRPASTKGQYVKKVVISASMGPGIIVDPILAAELETE
ncbi:MAG: 50S ribosomal protein L1 [Anaerolineales bacterium]|nr:50S ribosomal protein L1 [Anaerolineales bacterium]